MDANKGADGHVIVCWQAWYAKCLLVAWFVCFPGFPVTFTRSRAPRRAQAAEAEPGRLRTHADVVEQEESRASRSVRDHLASFTRVTSTLPGGGDRPHSLQEPNLASR